MIRNAAAPSDRPPSSDPTTEAPSSVPTPDLSQTDELMRTFLHEELGRRIDALHRFVDRRFDELSVEVHGAVQMVDFTESNLSGQIAAIHSQVAGMVAAPVESSRNSGVELEAVVEATENAAGRIMDAAEAISRMIEGRSDDERHELETNVNAIFEACSFQDLTGQRIRRAIAHLQSIETLLSQMMADPVSAPAEPAPIATATTAKDAGSDLAQDEIDRLLG
jgi:chemotaxis protein CheZ